MKLNRYMRGFWNAFQSVDVRYFQLSAIGKNDQTYDQDAENNFTSELTRKFRNLMESPENLFFYNGLVCDMDVLKGRTGDPIRPDLVLHGGQDNQYKQEIFAEVKVNKLVDLTNDFRKLERAISTDLNFNYAVMVVVNKSLQVTEQMILNFIDERFAEVALRKLFLFHAVKNLDNTATHTIKNFLKIRRQNG